MFTFPKKLPPRHKKKKKKKFSADIVSDDDVMKEKSNNSEQVDKKVSSLGFGKNVRGKVYLLSEYVPNILFYFVLFLFFFAHGYFRSVLLKVWTQVSSAPATVTGL